MESIMYGGKVHSAIRSISNQYIHFTIIKNQTFAARPREMIGSELSVNFIGQECSWIKHVRWEALGRRRNSSIKIEGIALERSFINFSQMWEFSWPRHFPSPQSWELYIMRKIHCKLSIMHNHLIQFCRLIFIEK